MRKTGLHHLSQIEKITIDHALITALVERWHPETNTFHLQSGEATITLEDVAYIYGLPIDGKPVMGRTFNGIENLISTCDKLLGSVPDTTNDCFGTQIKFSWIHKTFRTLPKKVTEEVEDRHTRAYLFYLVGTQIFSNTSGSRGNAFILNLFKNFEKYAWGQHALQTFIECWERHPRDQRPSLAHYLFCR